MVSRDDIDAMWQKAMHQSIKDGEQFTRYHFYELIASHVAEECAKIADNQLGNTNVLLIYPPQSSAARQIGLAIRSLYKPTVG